MSEPTTADTERPILFRGREIFVKMPTPEQLLVWKRVLKQLQEPEVTNGEQLIKLLERTRKLIDSILVNRADVEWLDDEMLDGNLVLNDTADIMLEAVKAFQADDNRESRRAAKKTPAKKAARRKATT
jgi:hypothetical protein